MAMRFFFPALLALTLPAAAQGLPERFREHRAAWEESLEKGQGTTVRKATEALLQVEGAAINPSDYNAMHDLVAVMNLAARACVLEGAWEDAVAHLEKAAASAAENESAAEATFSRLRRQHQEKVQEWQAELARQEKRIQDMEAQGGLTFDQIKVKGQLRASMDELRNAISHSEKSLREIDNLVALLRREREAYAASLAQWQGFLDKERADIARAGSPTTYVAEKVEQVKADDARPRPERLAYARRLLRLDSANGEARHFVSRLLGQDDEAAPAPAVPKAKPKARPKARKGKRRG
jgi:hypothetical protein